MMLFAAVRESEFGSFETCRAAPRMPANWGVSEVVGDCQNDAIDPKRGP